jgi:uncharacterized membrane protein (UPF0127 family)
MRTVALFAMIALGLVMAGCGDTTVSTDDDHTRLVTLPDGTNIRVEVMMHPNDMLRGLMFRESLAPDRGMLFIYGSPGNYSYWMFQVKIPLDILWMDSSRTVVEISENTPPCPAGSKKCQTYGGKYPAQFILELAAGSVAKHNLRVGNTLTF